MRPSFLADENISAILVQGLRLSVHGIDVVRVQEVGLRTLDDLSILAWAAAERRCLITRDARTIPVFVGQRIMAGQHVSGVFVLPRGVTDSMAITDLSLIASATDAQEWYDRIVYLPLG